MTFVEFHDTVWNFVDSIKMVYITAGFAFIGIASEWRNISKLKAECARLTAENIRLKESLTKHE